MMKIEKCLCLPLSCRGLLKIICVCMRECVCVCISECWVRQTHSGEWFRYGLLLLCNSMLETFPVGDKKNSRKLLVMVVLNGECWSFGEQQEFFLKKIWLFGEPKFFIFNFSRPDFLIYFDFTPNDNLWGNLVSF